MIKGRILIIEDNMDSYELMRFIMERNGYEVFLAGNGSDGINAAAKQKPDLILMDLSVPEMDGWDAAQQIKSNPKTKNVPIIALTAYALHGDRKRVLEAGCDGYLTTPIDPIKLVLMVDEALMKF